MQRISFLTSEGIETFGYCRFYCEEGLRIRVDKPSLVSWFSFMINNPLLQLNMTLALQFLLSGLQDYIPALHYKGSVMQWFWAGLPSGGCTEKRGQVVKNGRLIDPRPLTPTKKILKVRDSWLWRVLSGRLCGQGVCLPLHDGLSWHGLIGSS